MTQTVGRFLLETAALLNKAGNSLGIPVGKPIAGVVKKTHGRECLKSWVKDARDAMEFGLTPKEYASEIAERDAKAMLESLE